MYLRVMGYRAYEDIRRGNSVMSRRVIMIITISESVPSTCQFHDREWDARTNICIKNKNNKFLLRFY